MKKTFLQEQLPSRRARLQQSGACRTRTSPSAAIQFAIALVLSVVGVIGVSQIVDANQIEDEQLGIQHTIKSASLDRATTGTVSRDGEVRSSNVAARGKRKRPHLDFLNGEPFYQLRNGKPVRSNEYGRTAHLTIDPQLQAYAEGLMAKYDLPWGAIVALDPKTGRVLTLANHSEREPKEKPVALRGGFPAASLFKVVTAAAAIEVADLDSSSPISYRGGNYTLNKRNYQPNLRRDRRVISLGRALGKSCNPAMARVAMRFLSPELLTSYATRFGFNEDLAFDAPLARSTFTEPNSDYIFARTAAGFANASITPLHAALIAAAVANDGVMMEPYIIDRVEDRTGVVHYQSKPRMLKRALSTTASP